MKIEINNNNTEVVTLLLTTFLNMNKESNYNYIANDNLQIGYNENSGFSYIYLENLPHISLCTTCGDDLCVVYSSGLDGIEFVRYDLEEIKSLDMLEDVLSVAYNLDEDIRENDYKNEGLNDQFIEAMLEAGWEQL